MAKFRRTQLQWIIFLIFQVKVYSIDPRYSNFRMSEKIATNVCLAIIVVISHYCDLLKIWHPKCFKI